MRSLVFTVGSLLALVLNAQIHVETDIRFSGDSSGGRIRGLGTPETGSAAIPVSVMASGSVHWAQASVSGNTIQLTLTPAVQILTVGMLIRFVSPLDNAANVQISMDGISMLPVLNSSGEILPWRTLRQGVVAEVIYSGNGWILLDPAVRSCPTGTIRTTDFVCIDQASIPNLLFYQAVDHCAERGGKLCSWDEYAVGCALRQDQLTGMFNEWEWIDDSSNHTHTANQVGRTTCQSQRSANVLTLMTGDTRCCYRLR